jgi:hypothetical protein
MNAIDNMELERTALCVREDGDDVKSKCELISLLLTADFCPLQIKEKICSTFGDIAVIFHRIKLRKTCMVYGPELNWSVSSPLIYAFDAGRPQVKW